MEIDINHDSEIQVSEALNVYKLDLRFCNQILKLIKKIKYYKIGYTTNLNRRLKTYNTSFHIKFYLIIIY